MSIVVLPILFVGGDFTNRERQAQDLAKETSSSWDISLLDARIDAGIASVREFSEKLTRKPFNSPLQTGIILEASNLTVEAQNALLKNLEEPGQSVKLILTAATAESLLSTIVSRCRIEELKTREGEKLDKTKFKDFLSTSFYKRYLAADKLDLDAWTALWREILREQLFISTSSENIQKVVTYLKTLQKFKRLQKKRASNKLLNSIVLLSPPLKLIGD